MNKQYALVTGANRGIGKAIATKLSENYTVIGTSTSGKGETKAVSIWLKANFFTSEGIIDFIALLEEQNEIKVLVNNAGINIIKPQSNVTTDDYEKIQNINLKAPYQIAQVLAEKMAKTGGGKIIHIASIWGVISKSHRSLYSTMKTGLIGTTRATAAEWAAQNVLINAVSPGFVETELTLSSLTEEEQENMKSKIPINRFAQPTEIAEIVAFLSSSNNTYLTGQNIVVDGGFTIV